MKDTAVKFLIDEISCRFIISEELRIAMYKAIEMEKEQKGYSEEEVRLAYFQGEKDSYVKGGQTKEMEDEFIESLKNKLNK